MKIALGQHLSVVGQTGAGKSYFVRNAVLPAFPRNLVIDSTEDDFSDWPAVSMKTAVKLSKSKHAFDARVVYDFRRAPDIDKLWVDLLAEGGQIAVYLDEATDFADPGRITPELLQFIRKARHRKISMIFGSQRPQLLNKNFLANSQHRVWFYLSDYDCVAVKDYAPFLSDRRSEIPFGSYKSLYQAPDGAVMVLAPTREYNWKERLHR